MVERRLYFRIYGNEHPREKTLCSKETLLTPVVFTCIVLLEGLAEMYSSPLFPPLSNITNSGLFWTKHVQNECSLIYSLNGLLILFPKAQNYKIKIPFLEWNVT